MLSQKHPVFCNIRTHTLFTMFLTVIFTVCKFFLIRTLPVNEVMSSVQYILLACAVLITLYLYRYY